MESVQEQFPSGCKLYRSGLQAVGLQNTAESSSVLLGNAEEIQNLCVSWSWRCGLGVSGSQQPHFVTMKAMARQVRQHALMWSRTRGVGQQEGWLLVIGDQGQVLFDGPRFEVEVWPRVHRSRPQGPKGTGRRGQRKVKAPMKTVQREIMISLIDLQETEKGLVRSREDTPRDDVKCFLAAPHEFELPEASGVLNFRS